MGGHLHHKGTVCFAKGFQSSLFKNQIPLRCAKWSHLHKARESWGKHSCDKGWIWLAGTSSWYWWFTSPFHWRGALPRGSHSEESTLKFLTHSASTLTTELLCFSLALFIQSLQRDQSPFTTTLHNFMPHKVARELEMKPSKLHGLGKQKLRTIGSTEKLKVHISTKGLHLSLFFTKRKYFLHLIFQKQAFFQAVWGSEQNWAEVQRAQFACIPCSHTCTASPSCQQPPPEWHTCYDGWTYTDTS